LVIKIHDVDGLFEVDGSSGVDGSFGVDDWLNWMLGSGLLLGLG
jgi:hypothetical protein